MRPLRNPRQREKVKRQNDQSQARNVQLLFLLPFLLLPSAFKELLHQRAAFNFENAANHFHSMIQLTRIADVKVRIDGAGFFVKRAVYQCRHARLNQRAGAHRARLDG